MHVPEPTCWRRTYGSNDQFPYGNPHLPIPELFHCLEWQRIPGTLPCQTIRPMGSSQVPRFLRPGCAKPSWFGTLGEFARQIATTTG